MGSTTHNDAETVTVELTPDQVEDLEILAMRRKHEVRREMRPLDRRTEEYESAHAEREYYNQLVEDLRDAQR